eukprot:TRINITY_DN3276_c2_g2_i1.p1 TRINITY_DN3276_c2_g2~~TRINITY_DN3276_c2_g2_i1.p1  ORF type:complete len:521 (+),score=151.71 TRINITY_DN3276_c2_g2_i1:33-1595(+)
MYSNISPYTSSYTSPYTSNTDFRYSYGKNTKKPKRKPPKPPKQKNETHLNISQIIPENNNYNNKDKIDIYYNNDTCRCPLCNHIVDKSISKPSNSLLLEIRDYLIQQIALQNEILRIRRKSLGKKQNKFDKCTNTKDTFISREDVYVQTNDFFEKDLLRQNFEADIISNVLEKSIHEKETTNAVNEIDVADSLNNTSNNVESPSFKSNKKDIDVEKLEISDKFEMYQRTKNKEHEDSEKQTVGYETSNFDVNESVDTSKDILIEEYDTLSNNCVDSIGDSCGIKKDEKNDKNISIETIDVEVPPQITETEVNLLNTETEVTKDVDADEISEYYISSGQNAQETNFTSIISKENVELVILNGTQKENVANEQDFDIFEQENSEVTKNLKNSEENRDAEEDKEEEVDLFDFIDYLTLDATPIDTLKKATIANFNDNNGSVSETKQESRNIPEVSKKRNTLKDIYNIDNVEQFLMQNIDVERQQKTENDMLKQIGVCYAHWGSIPILFPNNPFQNSVLVEDLL